MTARKPLPTEADIIATYPELAPLLAALPPLCSVAQIAAAMHVSTKTIRRYIDGGLLLAARGGGSRVLIPRPEVLRLVACRLPARQPRL
jgi:excisionase family DNA binding protein